MANIISKILHSLHFLKSSTGRYHGFQYCHDTAQLVIILLSSCIHYFKIVKTWSSSIIMSWYDPWPRAHKKYTAFGLHGPALGLDLSVYGLGLVHAGLRRYIFRDPSARGRIISHCPLGKRYFRVIKSMQWIVEILNLLQSSSLVVSFLVSSLVQTYYQ